MFQPQKLTSRTARCATVVAAVALVAGLCTPSLATQDDTTVNLETLLNRMSDLSHLASYPETPFKTLQNSSYDRRSESPDDASDEGWFANGDRGQYLRTEENNGRKEWVMMDHQGPGAVVRIWSANPQGTLRIYLDGSDTPVIEEDMTALLDGEVEGIPQPIAGVRGKGHNLFLPIPFAESCKITSDQGDFYYIVNFQAYPEGTAVESLTAEQLEQEASAIRQAAQALEVERPTARGERPAETANATVAAGDTAELFTADEGPGAIRKFVAFVRSEDGGRLEGSDLENALRQTQLKITFDDQTTVEMPLGDFFGSAPGINPYATLPMAVGEDGSMVCRFVMPFEKSYRIEVTNNGDQSVQVHAGVDAGEWEWNDRSMHFRADFMATYDLATQPRKDMTFLEAEGKGVYVGTSMAIDNPTKGWWGEGDEKVYVDGESFPSWFGTGTEDYFGYAWCDTALFEHAYHSQSRCDGPVNYGRTSVNRFHVIDPIPFEESLQFDIEMWHWENVKVNVASVAYWYARPGAEATNDGAPEELEVRPLEPWSAPKVEGAIEAETMQIVSVPDHTTASPQSHGAVKSNGEQLWWRHTPRQGDELVLRFDLPENVEPGRHKVVGGMLMAPDYGRFDVQINGQSAAQGLDLYNAGSVIAKEIDLGEHELKAKGNEIRVKVAGGNPRAMPGRMFGLDYVKAVPAGN